MSRILVIDDEPKMTALISSSLSEAGYTIDTADTGQTAMEILRKQSFDLVLSDIRIPEPDGMEILDWLRSNRPETIVIIIKRTHIFPMPLIFI